MTRQLLRIETLGDMEASYWLSEDGRQVGLELNPARREVRRAAKRQHVDSLVQLRQMNKMGSITDLLKMVPGLGSKIKDVDIDEEQVSKAQKKNEAIILSMTRMERRNPDILNGSRKRRIAAGSGTSVQDVNLLLKQFDQARSMMTTMMGSGKRGRMRIPFGKMPKF